jgi:hypothetical protein
MITVQPSGKLQATNLHLPTDKFDAFIISYTEAKKVPWNLFMIKTNSYEENRGRYAKQ